VEYALIIALIAIVAIVSLLFLGDQIVQVLNDIGAGIQNATPAP
jgi:Flp pilus assembly pilin Flp